MYGGSSNDGTIYQATPTGVVTVLHNFTDLDGERPTAGLAQGMDGLLYGVAGGGANSFGVAFKVSIGGTFMSLFTFDVGNDGAAPEPGVIAGSDGNLYGVTSAGGSRDWGTVFKTTPSGAVTILHSFLNQRDDRTPNTALVQAADGYFYGTTQYAVYKIA